MFFLFFWPHCLSFFLNPDAKAQIRVRGRIVRYARIFARSWYRERVLRRSTHTRVVAYVRTISDYVLVDFLRRSTRLFSLFFLSFFLVLPFFLSCCRYELVVVNSTAMRTWQTQRKKNATYHCTINLMFFHSSLSSCCTLSKCSTRFDCEEDLPLRMIQWATEVVSDEIYIDTYSKCSLSKGIFGSRIIILI